MYILVFLYFIARSFYIFPSGSLQPFDFIFIINLLYFLLKEYSAKITKDIFSKFLYFTLWVVIVNLIWFFIDGFDVSYITSATYVIYNLLFCILHVSIYLYNKEKFEKYFQAAVLINLFMNVGFYLLGVGRSYMSSDRQLLFFNDPNQMGYYFSMILMLSYVMNLKYKHLIGLLSVFLVFISASRAALGMVVLFYLLLISYNIYVKKQVIFYLKRLALTALVLTIFISFYDISQTYVYQQYKYITVRLDERDPDDNIANRGWNRIPQYLVYTAFGYGEGGLIAGKKFRDNIAPHLETHSTWANFIVSYGIVGFVLFFMIFFQCVSPRDFMYYIPYLAHGIIQVDSRQTTFWLILFFLFIAKREKQALLQNKTEEGNEIFNPEYLSKINAG